MTKHTNMSTRYITFYRKWSLICRTQVIWLQNIIYLTPHSREISVVWSPVVSRVATKCCQHDGRYTCWVCQVMLNTSTLSLYIAAKQKSKRFKINLHSLYFYYMSLSFNFQIWSKKKTKDWISWKKILTWYAVSKKVKNIPWPNLKMERSMLHQTKDSIICNYYQARIITWKLSKYFLWPLNEA